MASNFWRLSNDIEAIAQLKSDLHDAIGRLLTRCYAMAKADPGCEGYWLGEARYWEQQYHESMRTMEQMINSAGNGHLPHWSSAVPAAPIPAVVPTVQEAKLHAALLSAFDEPGLRQLCRFELNVDLDQVAGGQDLRDRVYNLVMWATRTDRVADLIAGARRQNPTNVELSALTKG